MEIENKNIIIKVRGCALKDNGQLLEIFSPVELAVNKPDKIKSANDETTNQIQQDAEIENLRNKIRTQNDSISEYIENINHEEDENNKDNRDLEERGNEPLIW